MTRSQPTTRRTFVFGSLATALALPRRGALGAAKPIRMLTFPVALGALPFIARERGFINDAGLSIELNTIYSGPAALAAIAGGSIDIAVASAGAVANGVLRGLPFTIIADAARYDSKRSTTTYLCVARDSAIATASDMSGKTVAVNAVKQIAQATTRRWIDRNGGKSDTVNFIEWPTSEMVAGLQSGHLDVANIAEPELTMAGSKVKRICDPNAAVANVFSLSAFVCSRAWVKDNLDTARRFKSSMQRAAQWADANSRDAAILVAKFTNIDPTVALAMTPTPYPTDLSSSSLQAAVDVMSLYGYVPDHVNVETLITRV